MGVSKIEEELGAGGDSSGSGTAGVSDALPRSVRLGGTRDFAFLLAMVTGIREQGSRV